MFLQPPEELAGPNWSMNLVPSFTTAMSWSTATSKDVAPQPDSAPGFLVQAEAALMKHPDSPAALARLAQAAQAVGDVSGAVEHARRALELGLDSQDFGAVHAAMTLLSACGRARDAAALVDDPRAEAIPIGVRVRAAAAAGEFDAAQHLTGLEASPDALAVVSWIRTEQGDFSGAISAGRQAERDGAAGVTLYANLAYAHAAVGNLDKAVKLARQAFALSPSDRHLAFSLVQYLRLAAQHEKAVAVLQSLRDGDRTDIELALAIAKAHAEVGAFAEAHRVLQRARASQEWAIADDVKRAELTANLALLRWITNRDRAESSLSEILRALRTCDYRSLGIAYLLLNLMRTPAHASNLARVIGRLENRHPEDDLHGLRMLLAILRRDASGAVRHSKAWSERDLFNPFAAATATILVGEVAGDFDAAAELGLAALRRAPHDVMLLNNTAFALAMDGRLVLAQKLLVRGRRRAGPNVYLTATRGLVELLDGRSDSGRTLYRCAEGLAKSQGDPALAARVVVYGAFAERAAHAEASFGEPEELLETDEIAAWRELPLFWIACERAKRERTHATYFGSATTSRHMESGK